MMKIIITVLLVHIVHIHTLTLVKRYSIPSQGQSSGVSAVSEEVHALLKTVRELPVIGSYLEDTVIYLGDILEDVDDATAGVISRFIKSTQPCTFDKVRGIYCKGLAEKGPSGVMKEVIHGISPNVLPDIVKPLIISFIESASKSIGDSVAPNSQ